ncbi:monovalent cation/H+ antiporter complex subunit F [Desulfurococcus mucosus]|uniref:Multiple resistance and pH regulation protein F n=1 Tax=Desulfurococcus mucosus (strain ATCC 35584 / DSM 2162 / JCM 9187 / O7/1) TaxID=765177 RepID=E8R6Z1_DESM0|nr:monovalent cation/H+ antiporter complex subunit F [Desulfurococcus mucosus]ADV64424.1 multiple resistance and pH regulation protein F [Desulfurococcus mucosus DSM 2162]
MFQYIEYIAVISAPLYIAAIVLYTLRAVKGPTIPDIVLAIDCIAYDLAVFLALIALYYRSPLMITPSMLLALWAYLLDIFISKHLASKRVEA